ncbi:hypothetical protein SAZ11_06995 [Streptomyces sp. FXJ1.4098]|nr:hypothetical protein [Streptomyces sp. FXJ1.4098]
MSDRTDVRPPGVQTPTTDGPVCVNAVSPEKVRAQLAGVPQQPAAQAVDRPIPFTPTPAAERLPRLVTVTVRGVPASIECSSDLYHYGPQTARSPTRSVRTPPRSTPWPTSCPRTRGEPAPHGRGDGLPHPRQHREDRLPRHGCCRTGGRSSAGGRGLLAVAESQPRAARLRLQQDAEFPNLAPTAVVEVHALKEPAEDGGQE